MSWIKRNSKTEYLDFVRSIEAPLIIRNPLVNWPEKRLWIRHDVDYDLDKALKLAEYECDNGIHATYFLLHTTPYFDYSPGFAGKVSRFGLLGHEVGFHNNGYEVYRKTRDNTLKDIISPPVDFLREHAGEVIGTSCHGAVEHYKMQFFNYEMWTDFDIYKNEGHLHELTQIDLKEMGFEYEAYFLDYTHYFSDSGNNWIGYVVSGQKPFERKALESVDNLGADVIKEFNKADEGLFQLLIHPVHWEEV